MSYMQFWMYSSFQNISTSSYIIGLMIPLTEARNVDNRTLYAQSRYALIFEYPIVSSRRRGSFFAYFTLVLYGSTKNSNSKCQLQKISYRRVKNWIRAIRDFRLPSRSRWDTQRIVVIPYRRFGTTYRSHFQRSRNPRFLDLRIRAIMLVYRKRFVGLEPNNKLGCTWPKFPNHATNTQSNSKRVYLAELRWWVKENAAAVGLYSRDTDQQSVGHLAGKVCFKTSKIIISKYLNHRSDYSTDWKSVSRSDLSTKSCSFISLEFSLSISWKWIVRWAVQTQFG